MPALKIVLFVLLGLIISVFAVKNIKVPLLIVMLVSLGLGFLLAWIEGFISKLKLKATIRRQEKTIEMLNSDIEKLKTPVIPETTETSDFPER